MCHFSGILLTLLQFYKFKDLYSIIENRLHCNFVRFSITEFPEFPI